MIKRIKKIVNGIFRNEEVQVVELFDENGESSFFEFLSDIEDGGNKYVALTPFIKDNSKTDRNIPAEVFVMQKVADGKTLAPIADQDVVEKIFRKFKEETKDKFDFEDEDLKRKTSDIDYLFKYRMIYIHLPITVLCVLVYIFLLKLSLIVTILLSIAINLFYWDINTSGENLPRSFFLFMQIATIFFVYMAIGFVFLKLPIFFLPFLSILTILCFSTLVVFDRKEPKDKKWLISLKNNFLSYEKTNFYIAKNFVTFTFCIGVLPFYIYSLARFFLTDDFISERYHESLNTNLDQKLVELDNSFLLFSFGIGLLIFCIFQSYINRNRKKVLIFCIFTISASFIGRFADGAIFFKVTSLLAEVFAYLPSTEDPSFAKEMMEMRANFKPSLATVDTIRSVIESFSIALAVFIAIDRVWRKE